MNELEFIKQLETKGITLTPQQVNQFKQYFKILVEWNEKMNLTAITDEEGVYLKHFYDSLTIKILLMWVLGQDFLVYH